MPCLRRASAAPVGRPRWSAADSGVRLSPGTLVDGAPHAGPRRSTAVTARAILGPLGCGLAALAALTGATAAPAAGADPAPSPPPATSTAGPAPAYRCAFNVGTSAFTGADGTASAIGWLGDHNSVITCLGGSFVVQDGPDGNFVNDGFGVYGGQKTTWVDADGYLPAQITTFVS